MYCGILIIDDDAEDAEILMDAFEEIGVDDLCHMKTAKEAFSLLETIAPEHLPKLIITHHFLPGGSGRTFFAALKKIDKYKDMRVLVMSTTTPKEELDAYRQLGIIDYMAKPFLYEDYLKVVRVIKKKMMHYEN